MVDRMFLGLPVGDGDEVLQTLVLDLERGQLVAKRRCRSTDLARQLTAASRRASPRRLGLGKDHAVFLLISETGVNSTRAVMFGSAMRLVSRSMACSAWMSQGCNIVVSS